MAPEKEYNPQEPVLVTLTKEQWESVRHWLLDCAAYHDAKRVEWLANCKDGRMAAAKMAEHEKTAAEADTVRKIIEATLYPAPPTETE